ncbi:MAG TPA: hypothetical protein VHB99_13215 [Pirellulales bacterium]|nr:hypothetical protein [Pirellulales bacterium]
MKRLVAYLFALAAACSWGRLLLAEDASAIDAAVETPANAAPAQTPGPDPAQIRRALIICGLPGDAEHRKLFAESIEALYAALTTRHGFAAERIAVLFSGDTEEKDGPALKASRGPATREALAAAAAEWEQELQPDDALWTFVFGHAHFDGRASWLNLPGPDMNQIEFGKLFAEIKCREQAFFVATSASGYYLKPLAAPGRIVIVATEADFEVNETIFPHKLVKLLAQPPALAAFDVDGDGRATLLDAYLGAARDTAQEYASGELLATEHALIDDNGDGRGTELQTDYLTEELGGRLRAGRAKPAPRGGDGALARQISLAVPLVAPEPVPAAAEPTAQSPDSEKSPGG